MRQWAKSNYCMRGRGGYRRGYKISGKSWMSMKVGLTHRDVSHVQSHCFSNVIIFSHFRDEIDVCVCGGQSHRMRSFYSLCPYQTGPSCYEVQRPHCSMRAPLLECCLKPTSNKVLKSPNNNVVIYQALLPFQ